MNKSIDELLRAPYWIIDILPMQVPKDSPGQYFAVEKYYLSRPRLSEIKKKHVDTVLKLNCFVSLSLDEETDLNPPPERIEEAVTGRHVNIMLGDSMLVSKPDETYMTLYNPDEELLRLIRVISSGEGLYVWRPGQQNE
ncbi:MAG: hypothetical protein IKD89_03940 [Clostridia bacterium]|nr:hypothetical protein [Clostridia bacterium]